MQYTTAELERRMDRVRVLLETHDEIYDDLSRPETSAAQAGFGEPVRRILRCTCTGGCGQCERSAARAGELGIRLKAGHVLVETRDPYDTGREGSFDPSSRDKREDAARVDAVLERISEEQQMREGLIATVAFESILKRAGARDQRGSYRELRVALDAMPRSLRGDDAVAWIATRLQGTIRVPRWAFEQELERLREQAVTLKKAGLQVSEIATGLSVSQRQVKRLLKEAQAR